MGLAIYVRLFPEHADSNYSNLCAIPHTEQAYSDSEQEKQAFKRKKPPAEPGLVQVTICHDHLGVWEDRAETQKEEKMLM